MRAVHFLSAIAALVFVLAPPLIHWRQRRRLWLEEPRRLVEPPPRRPGLHMLVLALCVLSGAAGLLAGEHAATPPFVALAGITAAIVAHQQQRNLAAYVAFALVGESIVLAAMTWLPPFDINALLGCALAGGHALWLARFWRQQLLDGQAWTTAGRLIPVARRFGLIMAYVALAITLYEMTASPWFIQTTLWGSAITCMLLIGYAARLALLARAERRWAPALASVAALLSCVVPAMRILAGLGDRLIRAGNE